MVDIAVAPGVPRHGASSCRYRVVRDGISRGAGDRPGDPEPVGCDDAQDGPQAGPEDGQHAPSRPASLRRAPAGPEDRDHQGREAGPDEFRHADDLRHPGDLRDTGNDADDFRDPGIVADDFRDTGIVAEHAGAPGLASHGGRLTRRSAHAAASLRGGY